MGIYYRSSADLLSGKGEAVSYNRDVFPTPYPLPLISPEIVREIEASFQQYIFIEKRDKSFPRVKYHCTRCGNTVPGEEKRYIWTDDRTLTPDIMELISAPHNGYSHCPVCKGVGQVKEAWRIRCPDNYGEWLSFLVFQQAGPNEVFIRCISARRERHSELISGTSFSEWEFFRLTPRRCEFFFSRLRRMEQLHQRKRTQDKRSALQSLGRRRSEGELPSVFRYAEFCKRL